MCINSETQRETQRVVILGGYGNFGRRIAQSLSQLSSIELLIAGRDVNKATQLCSKLALTSRCRVAPMGMDFYSEDFANQLAAITPYLLIHTGGPFQGQDYRVPQACIAAGCHYIDLADDRRFVCDVARLHEAACAQKVLIVAGASSVPGLSSVVVGQLNRHFSRLDSIDIAIAPGNRAERGVATLRGILSYTGHGFTVFELGRWTERFGWMSPRKVDFGSVIGKRWLANVDIPDLELFPSHYSVQQTVRFQAGLELPVLHFVMVGMAWLARIGLIRNWGRFTAPIFKLSVLFQRFGSDVGGMRIALSGLGNDTQLRQLQWRLTALKGVGPYIPTIAAIILAKKLIANQMPMRGAMPCLDLFTLDEFDAEVASLDISHETIDGNG